MSDPTSEELSELETLRVKSFTDRLTDAEDLRLHHLMKEHLNDESDLGSLDVLRRPSGDNSEQSRYTEGLRQLERPLDDPEDSVSVERPRSTAADASDASMWSKLMLAVCVFFIVGAVYQFVQISRLSKGNWEAYRQSEQSKELIAAKLADSFAEKSTLTAQLAKTDRDIQVLERFASIYQLGFWKDRPADAFALMDEAWNDGRSSKDTLASLAVDLAFKLESTQKNSIDKVTNSWIPRIVERVPPFQESSIHEWAAWHAINEQRNEVAKKHIRDSIAASNTQWSPAYGTQFLKALDSKEDSELLLDIEKRTMLKGISADREFLLNLAMTARRLGDEEKSWQALARRAELPLPSELSPDEIFDERFQELGLRYALGDIQEAERLAESMKTVRPVDPFQLPDFANPKSGDWRTILTDAMTAWEEGDWKNADQHLSSLTASNEVPAWVNKTSLTSLAKLAAFLSSPDQASLVSGVDQFFDSLGDVSPIVESEMRLTISNAFQKRGEWDASNRVLEPIKSLADSRVPKWMMGATELHVAFNMAELNDFEAAKTHLDDASKLLKGTAIADRVQDFKNRLIASGKLTPELQMVALSLSDEVSRSFPRTTGDPAKPIQPLNPPKPTPA